MSHLPLSLHMKSFALEPYSFACVWEEKVHAWLTFSPDSVWVFFRGMKTSFETVFRNFVSHFKDTANVSATSTLKWPSIPLTHGSSIISRFSPFFLSFAWCIHKVKIYKSNHSLIDWASLSDFTNVCTFSPHKRMYAHFHLINECMHIFCSKQAQYKHDIIGKHTLRMKRTISANEPIIDMISMMQELQIMPTLSYLEIAMEALQLILILESAALTNQWRWLQEIRGGSKQYTVICSITPDT